MQQYNVTFIDRFFHFTVQATVMNSEDERERIIAAGMNNLKRYVGIDANDFRWVDINLDFLGEV